MDPIRMMIDSPGDVEAFRRVLLKMAPRMEAKQPGITQQLQVADLTQPMQMPMPSGGRISIQVEPRHDSTAIKVAVHPPGTIHGRFRQGWWRWRTRLIARWVLKSLRKAIARESAAA